MLFAFATHPRAKMMGVDRSWTRQEIACVIDRECAAMVQVVEL
jgi:hypothetical protein